VGLSIYYITCFYDYRYSRNKNFQWLLGVDIVRFKIVVRKGRSAELVNTAPVLLDLDVLGGKNVGQPMRKRFFIVLKE
jgi:hypothetical protein